LGGLSSRSLRGGEIDAMIELDVGLLHSHQGGLVLAQMAIDDFGGKCWISRSASSLAITNSSPTSAAPLRGAGTTSSRYLIVDVPVSAVGLAVQTIANEKKKLFISHSTGSADFHGKFLRSNCSGAPSNISRREPANRLGCFAELNRLPKGGRRPEICGGPV
jgi:hypothetical protein